MKTRLVYLIRHGEDDPSVRGGWGNSKLTENGIEQVQKLSTYLKENCKIDKILSSDIERARQTAEIINSKLNTAIEYTEKLREMNNGLLAGMKNSVAEEKFPGVYFNTLEIDEKFPGGESPIEFYNRITKDFEQLLEENKDVLNIAMVTHGGVINAIYKYINNQEWSNKIKSVKISNACFYALEINEKERKFIIENYTVNG
ncbi:MAG: histidine phosphatase family protein [Clostridia bacterium]|nr:histidine phosphatase family protein [Clostridia bacterium]